MKPMSVSTTRGRVEKSRGTILVPFDRQTVDRDTIHAMMKKIATEDGLTVEALTSGASATGTAGIDMGGPSMRVLEKPEILLVMGDGTSLYDAGEIWHLLDYRMDTPVTIRPRDNLGDIDWSRYTHIVIPSGEFDEYEPRMASAPPPMGRRGRHAGRNARCVSLGASQHD